MEIVRDCLLIDFADLGGDWSRSRWNLGEAGAWCEGFPVEAGDSEANFLYQEQGAYGGGVPVRMVQMSAVFS